MTPAPPRGIGWIVLMGVALALAGVTGFTGNVEATPRHAESRQEISFLLSERNDSGLSGVVNAEASGEDTRIEVSLEGSAGSYLLYLQRGTCDAFVSDDGIPLAVTEPGVAGNTIVDLTIDQLVDGGYVIDVHAAEGTMASLMDPETSVACGAFQAEEGTNEIQTPVAGIGPLPDGPSRMVPGLLTGVAATFALLAIYTRRKPQPVAVTEVDSVALQRLRGMFL